MFKPRKIEIVNFMGHEQSTFVFREDSATEVYGVNNYDEGSDSNGSGKSSILEAISVAFINTSLIKGIDIKALNKIGIDIKTDETDIDVDLSYVGKTNFEGYTVKNIKEVEFPEFCENGGYDGEYLTKKMKQIWE